MWILGVLALVAGAVAISQLVSRSAPTAPSVSLWDFPRTTATYTTIVGMLAGFTGVVTMFFANLTVARSSPEFEAVIGMLLIAFLLFVAAAMQFGTTPNAADRNDEQYLQLQRTSYQLANLCFFCALSSSWLALKLFLDAIALPRLASVFTWILLFVVFSGVLRMAQFTFRMTRLSKATCLSIPFLGFALAVLYRQALLPAVPLLQPPHPEPFHIAVVLFALGAVGFSWQSTAIMMGDEGVGGALSKRSDRLLLAYLQAVAVTTATLWLAVAFPSS